MKRLGLPLLILLFFHSSTYSVEIYSSRKTGLKDHCTHYFKDRVGGVTAKHDGKEKYYARSNRPLKLLRIFAFYAGKKPTLTRGGNEAMCSPNEFFASPFPMSRGCISLSERPHQAGTSGFLLRKTPQAHKRRELYQLNLFS